MESALSVLIVEDSEDDAMLLLRELRRGGYNPVFERVDTPEAMKAALDKQTWDVVIADYVMPRFSGPGALSLLHQSGFDLPFIIVSGKIGEDIAVEAMKAGAHDYFLKGNLARLIPAIKREIQEAAVRRERRRAEEALRKLYQELEIRVNERTAQLARTNEALQVEITERKFIEEKLHRAQLELEMRVQERTAELEESIKEKEILLREIHHRVKNNMQVISGLLMLQEDLSTDKKLIEVLKDSQNRIASMALIHEKLYRSENLSKIDFKVYVEDLVSSLFASYNVCESKISLHVNVENVLLGVDVAIPCGLIINELVSNSLKHAFPDSKNGEIKILLHSTDGNMIELLVKDNGIGIPEEMDFRKTESLGLHLVNILVKNQFHGDIKLNRDKGTEFEIKFRGIK